MTDHNVYPHTECGGFWEECPKCKQGWKCNTCGMHANETALEPFCKEDADK